MRMSETSRDSTRSDNAGDDVTPAGVPPIDAGEPNLAGAGPAGSASSAEIADADDAEVGRALARMAREQLAREIADIERAAAILRLAEPALQSWSKPTMPVLGKPRPLWLLIGVLWLSTALVTAGTVVAIATLAG
jgi:hypothetical protein